MKLRWGSTSWVYNGRVAWELDDRIGWLLAHGWDAKQGDTPEGYSQTGPCGVARAVRKAMEGEV